MAKMSSKSKLRLVSYLAFLFFAYWGLNAIVVLIGYIADFFTEYSALGADFWASDAFREGVINILTLVCFGGLTVTMALMLLAIYEQGTPFLSKVPRLMKISAIFLFAMTVGCGLIVALIYNMQKHLYGIYVEWQQLLFWYTDLPILLGLVLLCLAYAFEHGFALQQENDEIL